MERTKNRAMVTQAIPKDQASIFAVILGVLGMTILYGWTNSLVVAIGIIGWIVYVWLYGMLSKRKSVHGTLVGAVSGAMPIVAGYVAVRGAFDAGALIVFIVLAAWQMPEFYSIGIYRLKEYKAAGVPILPVIKGVPGTIKEIVIYTCIFVIASLLLTPFGYTGYSYLAVMAVFGAYWLWLGYKGFKAENKDVWARKMFKFSLTMLLLFSAMISVGPLLP
jgi:protoheme IX farnesyltransferase